MINSTPKDEPIFSKKNKLVQGLLIFFSVIITIGLLVSIVAWVSSIDNTEWMAFLLIIGLLILPIIVADRVARIFGMGFLSAKEGEDFQNFGF
jgi:uncharacterized membrane protein